MAADPALLAETLCFEEERVVARDNTVACEGRRLQSCPPAARGPTTSKCANIPTAASRCSTARDGSPAIPRKALRSQKSRPPVA